MENSETRCCSDRIPRPQPVLPCGFQHSSVRFSAPRPWITGESRCFHRHIQRMTDQVKRRHGNVKRAKWRVAALYDNLTGSLSSVQCLTGLFHYYFSTELNKLYKSKNKRVKLSLNTKLSWLPSVGVLQVLVSSIKYNEIFWRLNSVLWFYSRLVPTPTNGKCLLKHFLRCKHKVCLVFWHHTKDFLKSPWKHFYFLTQPSTKWDCHNALLYTPEEHWHYILLLSIVVLF